MQTVSFHMGAMPSRWRPDVQVAGNVWRPSAPPSPGRALARVRPLPAGKVRLGQMGALETVDYGLSVLAGLAAAVTGFGLALGAPRHEPTWKWVGGLIGSVGTLRFLHDVSKLG
jgi:hypothetical protein